MSKELIISQLKADPRRDIYEAASGPKLRGGSLEYYISFQGGGPFQRQLVHQMVDEGILRRKYPTGECYELANPQHTDERGR